MKFVSKNQGKKCFATKGFGGKVNCDKATNQKSLPVKVKSKKIK